jgi:hypothetical protein
MEADEYEIDLDTFGAFVDALVRRYVASRHPIFRCLLEGCSPPRLSSWSNAAASSWSGVIQDGSAAGNTAETAYLTRRRDQLR